MIPSPLYEIRNNSMFPITYRNTSISDTIAIAIIIGIVSKEMVRNDVPPRIGLSL